MDVRHSFNWNCMHIKIATLLIKRSIFFILPTPTIHYQCPFFLLRFVGFEFWNESINLASIDLTLFSLRILLPLFTLFTFVRMRSNSSVISLRVLIAWSSQLLLRNWTFVVARHFCTFFSCAKHSHHYRISKLRSQRGEQKKTPILNKEITILLIIKPMG